VSGMAVGMVAVSGMAVDTVVESEVLVVVGT